MLLLPQSSNYDIEEASRIDPEVGLEFPLYRYFYPNKIGLGFRRAFLCNQQPLTKCKHPASQVDKPGSTQPVIKPPASQVFEDTDEPGFTQPVIKRHASQVFDNMDTDEPGSTQPVIKPPASQVFEDEDTDEPGPTQLQIPEHLYMFIEQALDLEKQLQTSKMPDYLRSKLKTVNLIIANCTQSYILSGSLAA
nr:hypothetical protein [Tanacetum cinerariifolium]